MMNKIKIFFQEYIQKFYRDALLLYVFGGLLFVLLYFLIPSKYTVNMQILPDAEGTATQNISSLMSFAQNFGFGGSQGASIHKVIPEVMNSRFVIEKIIKSKYMLKDDSSKKNIFEIFSFPENEQSLQLLLNIIRKNIIHISENLNTNVINIKITTSDPDLSSQMSNNLITYTDLYFSSRYKTRASIKGKILVKRRVELLKKLDSAQKKLIKFVEKNQKLTSTALDSRYDFLQNEVDRLRNIYNEISTQYELNNIEILGQSPVLNVLDNPSPPTLPSNKRKLHYFLIYFGLMSILLIIDIYIKEVYKI